MTNFPDIMYFSFSSDFVMINLNGSSKNVHMSRAMRKCDMSYANNKGADQPAHPRSLISAFVVRCFDSIISLDSIAEISSI